MLTGKNIYSKALFPNKNGLLSKRIVRFKSGNPSLKEFQENFTRILQASRFSESDNALANFKKQVGKRTDLEPLDYFRSFNAITESLVNGDVSEAEKATLLKYSQALQDILHQTQIANDPEIKPVKIAVTGAAGAIGYATLFRIASGHLLGRNVPVELHLLEIPQSKAALEGVVMELKDAAFPLLRSIKTFDNAEKAFEDIDFALLIGAQPRTKGMERGDLLKKNGDIFSAQGKALNKTAKKTVKVVVVGNPANTNCLIAAHNAPSLDPQNFSAMTRLDHTRGLSQLSSIVDSPVTDIEKFAVWGNHSATQFPSIDHALIKGRPARDVLKEVLGEGTDKWVEETFIPNVQNRGAEIIQVRGSSSAASAGSACLDHVRDWVNGTNGEWTSMAVYSKGEYGVTKGLYFSYPVVTGNGKYDIVSGLELDAKAKERFEKTHKELLAERDSVASLLK